MHVCSYKYVSTAICKYVAMYLKTCKHICGYISKHIMKYAIATGI